MAGEVFHAPLIEAVAGLELAAIVTRDPERRRRATAAHPHAALVDSTADLWSAAGDLGLRLVVVAAPNRAHAPAALDALAAGLHVVVDKPLAVTAEDGRRVVAEAERRGLVLSVFHNRRWDGDFLTVRRLLDDGELGDVWRFESRFERWRPERLAEAWRAEAWRERGDPAEGGGLLMDLGSHLIDQAVVLFGPPVSVYAELGRRRPGADVDDDTFVALEHGGGVTSHLWASSVASRPGPRFRVLGSNAGYVVAGMDVQEAALAAGDVPGAPGWGEAPAVTWGAVGAGDDVEPVPTVPGDYRRFYEAMVAAVDGGASAPVAPGDALLTLEVIEAARRSAATREVVAL